jgi:hypothetical protein
MHRSCRRCSLAVLTVGGLSLTAAGAALASSAGTGPLTALLPRSGELAGFSAHGAVQSPRTIAASVATDPSSVRATDTAQLRRDGFAGEVEQLYGYTARGGIGTSQGLASVTAFDTAAGASAYQRFVFGLESKPSAASGTAKQTRFVRVSVPGVPGAEGAAAIGRTDKRSAVNLVWAEGRCLVQLGDSVPGTSPVQAPLIKAAEAVAKRTNDTCAI